MKESGLKKLVEYGSHFYILSFIIKCEWNKLVECGTDENSKSGKLMGDGGSIIYLLYP